MRLATQMRSLSVGRVSAEPLQPAAGLTFAGGGLRDAETSRNLGALAVIIGSTSRPLGVHGCLHFMGMMRVWIAQGFGADAGG